MGDSGARHSTLTPELFTMVRTVLKLSQDGLAERIGLGRSQINLLERKLSPIRVIHELALNAVCVADLGLTLQEVLSGEVSKLKKHRDARIVHRWLPSGDYMVTVTDKDGSLIADIVTSTPVEAKRLVKYGFGIEIDLNTLGL